MARAGRAVLNEDLDDDDDGPDTCIGIDTCMGMGTDNGMGARERECTGGAIENACELHSRQNTARIELALWIIIWYCLLRMLEECNFAFCGTTVVYVYAGICWNGMDVCWKKYQPEKDVL